MGNYTGLNTRLKVVSKPVASIDDNYGPYDNVEDALNSIPLALRAVGLTVGIQQNNNIVEYWFQDGITDSHLKEKKPFNIYFTNEYFDTYKDGLLVEESSIHEIQNQNIIQLIDSYTKENVNYEETAIWHDGTAMDDTKVDNVIYRKKGGKYYQRKYDGAINAKWFGVVGNGIDDDTLKIQEAFDCVENIGGGTVFFPSGIYIYDGFLLIGEGTTVSGSGIGATIFKCKDNSQKIIDGEPVAFGFKSGISFAEIKDIEIDGNSANNRNWGSGYQNWAALEYEGVNAHGIWMTAGYGLIQPEKVILNNLYIHDTVRSGIVGSCREVLICNNIIVENSDADHPIYVVTYNDRRAIFNNTEVRGFSRSALIDVSGVEFNNLIISNITENPTIYDNMNLFSNRTDALLPTQINNCKIVDLDPMLIINIFSVNKHIKISNINISFASTINSKVIRLFETRQNIVSSLLCDNLVIKNAPKGLLLLFLSYSATGVHFSNFNIEFDPNSPDLVTPQGFLFQQDLSTSFKNSSFDKIIVSNNGISNIFRAFPDSSNTTENIIIQDCYFHTGTIHATYAMDGSNVKYKTIVMERVVFKEIKLPAYSVSIRFIDCREESLNRVSNLKDYFITSGDGTRKTFDIPNTLFRTPSFVMVTENSADAAKPFYVIRGLQNIRISYLEAPIAGTDNLVFSYEASI